jgi:hypothetical protein
MSLMITPEESAVITAAQRWATIQRTRLAADDQSDLEAHVNLLAAVDNLWRAETGSKLNIGLDKWELRRVQDDAP